MLPTLFVLSGVLIVGLLGGEAAARAKLPRVTGWIAAGLALRTASVPGFDPASLGRFGPVSEFVLGYIAFIVGWHLNLRRLGNAGRRLSLIILTEALVTPAVVTTALVYLAGLPPRTALFLAAVALAGAPGTTIAVANEARAKGVFTKTLVAAVALIDMVAVCFFETVHVTFSAGDSFETPYALISRMPQTFLTVTLFAGAVGLAGAALIMFLTRMVLSKDLEGVALVTAIPLTWGLAKLSGQSAILACTALGMAMANLMPEAEASREAYVEKFQAILFTTFFTLAGFKLDFTLVSKVAWIVVVFVIARALGKWASSFLAMSLAGAPLAVRNYLGPALLPHGGVAVGLVLLVEGDPTLADIYPVILATGLSALAINQFLGPSATKAAIGRAGEAGMDRVRLLDFLVEENIHVDFQAEAPEQAIESLVDMLVSTQRLEAERDVLLASALKREAESSTCVGEGLMIPHCVSDSVDDMVGVMAISRTGLPFMGPEGRQIHCVVLLVTAPDHMERHLAVLAALARAIGTDAKFQGELYHVKTAAHAYQLLHADDAEDFNHFLED